METTFITIHDLSPEAQILYSSDSIVDILGFSPDEVVNRSCWEFFHPDELPLARATHGRGIDTDKAAVLSYCRMRDKEGHWIGCEVVFTVVYDVMVGCTSIYRRGLKSQSRAAVAPAIRRLFTTSPRDPRYHMLSHLSTKFFRPSKPSMHEPRAALFLNRYTRTLTIMYATNGLAEVLGISGEQLRGLSFYYCIQENCLQDAVRCLENAKANDSIAYLRFWFRDPRQDDHIDEWHDARAEPQDDMMEDVRSSDEDNDTRPMHHHDFGSDSQAVSSAESASPPGGTFNEQRGPNSDSRTSSENSSNTYSHEAVFGEPQYRRSSSSSLSASPNSPNGEHYYFQESSQVRSNRRPIELEAVVSCTSDGLVVCLRRARPLMSLAGEQASQPMYTNGLFASPWATQPILPPPQMRPQYAQHTRFAPGLAPANSFHTPTVPQNKLRHDDFMDSIRDCAVFAWGLTGINGSLADYGYGKPRGESQPASGLPVWQREASQHGINADDIGRSNMSMFDFGNGNQRNSNTGGKASLSHDPFGDPGLSLHGNKSSAVRPQFNQ